jgi:hypothetical protein
VVALLGAVMVEAEGLAALKIAHPKQLQQQLIL